MGSEIGITFSGTDIDAVLRDLRALALLDPDVSVSVIEEPFCGLAVPVWGRLIPPGDDGAWSDAHEDVSVGGGSVETIFPADGSPSIDAFVCDGPFRERVLASLAATGSPAVYLDTVFATATVVLRQGDTPLVLHFDRSARATGGITRGAPGSLPALSGSDAYALDGRRPGGIPAHIAVMALLDRLERHGVLERDDTTGYLDARDADAALLEYLDDRRIRGVLAEVFAAVIAGGGPLLRAAMADPAFRSSVDTGLAGLDDASPNRGDGA